MRKSLGSLELELLRFLTETGALPVAEVVARFGEPRHLARTTVITVMERLRHKGFLARTKIGGAYHYEAQISRIELLTDLVRDFVRQSLGGSVAPLTAYLTESEDIDAEELMELRRMVAKIPDPEEGKQS